MCDKAFIASETIKNNYEVNIAYYDDKLLKRTLEERRVISEFEGAIEKKEFKMFLQPQVNTHGKVYGAEALVRWQHPERGLLSPFSSLIFWRRQVLYISLICICGNVQQLN